VTAELLVAVPEPPAEEEPFPTAKNISSYVFGPRGDINLTRVAVSATASTIAAVALPTLFIIIVAARAVLAIIIATRP
jgi:hypothetical protein